MLLFQAENGVIIVSVSIMSRKTKREQIITTASFVGVAANVALVGIKMLAGVATSSIAIILDAVNNLTDAISSIVTLIGTKLAGRKPDREHPYGHGRAEYLTALIVTIIILFTGIMAFCESVGKIVDPGSVDYSFWTLGLVTIAVIVKIWLGFYVKRQGNKVNSSPLIAAGQDALMDAFLSFATLLAGILNLVFGWRLEGWIGIMIACLIIKTALSMMSETTTAMLGQRTDIKMAQKIRKYLLNNDTVQAVYDLALHDYGPTNLVGSAKIQVSSSLTAIEIHKITQKLEAEILRKYDVAMTIGIYAQNSDAESEMIWQTIKKLVAAMPEILQVHGLLVESQKKRVYFDAVIDWQEENPKKAVRNLVKELESKHPEYTFTGNIDVDVSVS